MILWIISSTHVWLCSIEPSILGTKPFYWFFPMFVFLKVIFIRSIPHASLPLWNSKVLDDFTFQFFQSGEVTIIELFIKNNLSRTHRNQWQFGNDESIWAMNCLLKGINSSYPLKMVIFFFPSEPWPILQGRNVLF